MKKYRLALFIALAMCIFNNQRVYAKEELVISNEQRILATLEAHPNITRLIVGCGKDPYNWKPSNENGEKKWLNDSDTGNHDHEDSLTLAETEDVKPDIVWDWTKPVPECLIGRFSLIYLEKLPPRVLEQSICMENLRGCLKPGGLGVFDHQLYNVEAISYAIISPFCISVTPPPTSDTAEIDKLTNLNKLFKDKFNKLAGIPPNITLNSQNMSRTAFEALLLANPDLEKINALMYANNVQISSIKQKFLAGQNREILQFTDAIYALLKKQMKSLGFETADIQANITNPHNGRKNAVLVKVEKKK